MKYYILLGLLILLLCRISVFVSYIDNTPDIRIKFAGLTFYSSGRKKRRKLRRGRGNIKDKAAEPGNGSKIKPAEANTCAADVKANTGDKNNKKLKIKNSGGIKNKKKKSRRLENLKDTAKENLSEIIGRGIKILKAMAKYTKRLFKSVKIQDLYLDFIIGDKDAYECAMKFGKMNIAVYNILALLCCFFSVSKKSINIGCDFNKTNCLYRFSFKIKFPLIALFIYLLGILCVLIANTIVMLIGNARNKPAES